MKKYIIFCFLFCLLGFYCNILEARQRISKFQFPFDGAWKVMWGGLREEDNTLHIKVAAQRYAYDFVKVDQYGKYASDKIRSLGDYFSFGANVYSPADGIVTSVVEGVPDALVQNPNFVPGNMISIQHRNKIYSFIAHLQKGSILVREGDRVRRGQLIAKCGNSGNSTMPHIHFHVTDSPNFNEGNGIPISFHDIAINGIPKKTAIPKRGDIVSND